jgi:hypothetical protein
MRDAATRRALFQNSRTIVESKVETILAKARHRELYEHPQS